MQALEQKVIELQQQIQARDQQMVAMELMVKDNVLMMIKGTLSHLLGEILNIIEDVYKSFCILSDGVVHCYKFLADLKEIFEGWKTLGPKIKDSSVVVSYMSKPPQPLSDFCRANGLLGSEIHFLEDKYGAIRERIQSFND